MLTTPEKFAKNMKGRNKLADRPDFFADRPAGR
jgi:hypothetical protein